MKIRTFKVFVKNQPKVRPTRKQDIQFQTQWAVNNKSAKMKINVTWCSHLWNYLSRCHEKTSQLVHNEWIQQSWDGMMEKFEIWNETEQWKRVEEMKE